MQGSTPCQSTTLILKYATMGQIADDMINGCACQLCGCYFEDDDEGTYQHDIPVVCFDCWEELDSEERMYYTRAVKSTL